MNASPRPTPLTAFLVGTLGIATFSGMDAVMKGLVLALGTYATMVWRMLAGVAMAGALFAAQAAAGRTQRRCASISARGVADHRDGGAVLLGAGARAAGAGDRPGVHRPADRLVPRRRSSSARAIGPRTIGASLIAFAGVVLIFVGQAQADLGREALLGSVAILVSAVCYAVNIILMRQQALVARPIEIAFFQNHDRRGAAARRLAGDGRRRLPAGRPDPVRPARGVPRRPRRCCCCPGPMPAPRRAISRRPNIRRSCGRCCSAGWCSARRCRSTRWRARR